MFHPVPVSFSDLYLIEMNKLQFATPVLIYCLSRTILTIIHMYLMVQPFQHTNSNVNIYILSIAPLNHTFLICPYNNKLKGRSKED